VGFTIVELLVSLGVISLLLSLLVPAVMRSRNNARRIQCVNNLRQLAMAMLQNEEVQRRLPASGNFDVASPRQFHGWPTAILGEIELVNLLRQYDFHQPHDDPANLVLTHTPVPLFVCPDDISAEPGRGNLSYVVNGGFAWTIPVDCPASMSTTATASSIAPLDLNGNGIICPFDPRDDTGPGELPDIEYLRRTSLFFVENWPRGRGTQRHHRITDIRDGSSQTLMISENVRAGYDPEANSSWGSPDPRYNMFFISSRICADRRCAPGNVDFARANDRTNGNLECINCSLHQPEGAAPWLSSLHTGGVNAAFCDGHVSFVSENIAGEVLAALATPVGTMIKGPLAEAIVSGDL